MNDKGYNISGRVLLDPYDSNDQPTGFLDPFNCTSFKVNIPAQNQDTLIDNRQGFEGQLLGTRYIPKPPEVEIKLSTFPPEMLAARFMGVASSLSVTGSTGTNLPVTLIPKRWVKLPHDLCYKPHDAHSK